MADVEHVVGHRRHRRLGRVGLVGHGTGHEPAHEHVDPRVEGGREHQPLGALRRLLEDPAHGREEAEVGHVVGLVEHGDLDAAEVEMALGHQVLEAAGTSHDDVDAPAQAGDLRVLADATEDGERAQPGDGRQGGERGVDLRDELTGGGQDQRPRPTGGPAPVARGETGHEGQEEGVRLAGAGAATAEDVAASQRVGQGGRLDRAGDGDAAVGEHDGEVRGDAESGEGRVDGHRGVLQKGSERGVPPGANRRGSRRTNRRIEA